MPVSADQISSPMRRAAKLRLRIIPVLNMGLIEIQRQAKAS